MNNPVVGIDLGEKESVATYLLPDGTEKDRFTFTMDIPDYNRFSEKIPKDVRIAFEASGSAYVVDRNLKRLVRMIFVMLMENKKWKYEVTSLTEDKVARLEED